MFLSPSNQGSKMSVPYQFTNRNSNCRFKVNNNEIINAENDRNNKFTFAIDIDFSELPNIENCIKNKDNYHLANGYKITNIDKIDGVPNFTHRITFETSTLSKNENFSFGMPFACPSWVEDSNSNDDSNPTDSSAQHRTFGLKIFFHYLYS